MKNMVGYIFCSSLIVTSFFIMSMHKVEQEIFLREVGRIGLDAIRLKIDEVERSQVPYKIVLNFRDRGKEDLLCYKILKAIKAQDLSDKYLSDLIMNRSSGNSKSYESIYTCTRYCHKHDMFGHYLECIFIFKNINEMRDLLEKSS